MKTNGKLVISPIEGMDERYPANPKSADLVQNMYVNKRTKGWDSRIGYEKYLPKLTNFSPWSGNSRIDSVYIWSRHAGAQQWVLYETEGAIYYLKPFQASVGATAPRQYLLLGRSVPTPSEPCTQYCPMGRFLMILNGSDRPMKWAGWPLEMKAAALTAPVSKNLYPLGWDAIPSPPQPWDVQVNPQTLTPRSVSIPAQGDDIFLGDPTETGTPPIGHDNVYYYRVTFVNNAGSESPISSPSQAVSWTTPPSGYPVVGVRNKTYATMLEIPRGPDGTVARRIYRTKNQASSFDGQFDIRNGDGLFYYVGQVDNNSEEIYLDVSADTLLGSAAPLPSQSTPFPASLARFAAVYQGCLFLDGGADEDTRLYYSDPGKPDTYNALSFMDLSGTEGGAITGLYSHYNILLVFRERSVAVVLGNYNDGFQATTLRQNISPRGINTVASVPDLGVVFLCEDGIYVMKGGNAGGATMDIVKISDPISGTLDRLNKDLLPRAVGGYSPKWREYHVYFAADGQDRPLIGVVLHLDTLQWSVRTQFPVGALAVNPDGEFIFGHHTGIGGGATGSAESGLFVITKKRQAGYTVTLVDGEYVVSNSAPPISTFRCPFHHFGEPQRKKFVKFVYLYVLTTGSNTFSLTYFKDYETSGLTSPAMQMQPPDRPLQKVYDTALLGTDSWERPHVTEIRYPIADGACSHFQFEISSTNDFVLVGYCIDYDVNNTSVIRGRS